MIRRLQNSRYMQYLCAVTATISIAADSTYSVWPSPALPNLQSEESPVGRPISDGEGSWIVAWFLLGTVPGAILGGILIVEKLGRKKALLIAVVLLFIPWLMIIFGKHIMLLYIARGVAGIGNGITVISCSIYIGEIAENDIRGKLGTTFIVLKLVGSMIVLCIGPYVSYTWLAVICSILPILFMVLFVFMPESPYYLMKRGDRVNAEKNLKILSSKLVDEKFIQGRLSEIEHTVEEDMRNKATIWEFLSNKDYRMSIIIMAVIKTLQQFSGLPAVEAYMQSIIELTGSNISSEASSIIFGVIQLPAALAASFLIDKIGRRPLLITSALGCAVAACGEGIYFYLQDVLEVDVSALAWLPTTGIALFLVMNSLGVIILPYVLLGELFATNIKGIAVSVTTIYGGSTAFLVSKFFKPVSNAWGVYTVFWIFAAIAVLGSVSIYFCLPETKGKSFSEIQDVLKENRINVNKRKDNSC